MQVTSYASFVVDSVFWRKLHCRDWSVSELLLVRNSFKVQTLLLASSKNYVRSYPFESTATPCLLSWFQASSSRDTRKRKKNRRKKDQIFWKDLGVHRHEINTTHSCTLALGVRPLGMNGVWTAVLAASEKSKYLHWIHIRTWANQIRDLFFRSRTNKPLFRGWFEVMYRSMYCISWIKYFSQAKIN